MKLQELLTGFMNSGVHCNLNVYSEPIGSIYDEFSGQPFRPEFATGCASSARSPASKRFCEN